ncbi:unnamed protein product, partial [Mesorhabditis spiculigera]
MLLQLLIAGLALLVVLEALESPRCVNGKSGWICYIDERLEDVDSVCENLEHSTCPCSTGFREEFQARHCSADGSALPFFRTHMSCRPRPPSEFCRTEHVGRDCGTIALLTACIYEEQARNCEDSVPFTIYYLDHMALQVSNSASIQCREETKTVLKIRLDLLRNHPDAVNGAKHSVFSSMSSALFALMIYTRVG